MEKRNLKGSELEAYKSTLVLTKEQKEVIYGTVLGDATFGGLREGKPFYGLEFTQSKKHEGYLYHLYEIFEPFTGTPPKERLVGTNKTKDNVTIKFRTYRHNIFIPIHQQFCQMKEGKLVKIIPQDIGKFVTDRSLAYWFMDDGTSQLGISQFQFCTDCFSYDEQVILKEMLKDNFNVTRYKKTYRLSILAESKNDFISIIKPYVSKVECMKYKINA